MSKHPTKQNKVEPYRGFAHKKSLGQNFLTSNIVPGWMCDAALLQVGETILEIGPGTGALTRVLLERGAKVIAIEADLRAIEILKETFAIAIEQGKLTLVHDDARELQPHKLGLTHQNFKVVANIPYYLSGFLLRNLLQTPVQPSLLVFLMQKEVVTRIAREPKSSILSLSVEAFGKPKYIKTVGKGHFNPPPKVDSAILQISDISHDNFTSPEAEEQFFNLLHLGFGQKRKQLIANLSNVYNRTQVTTILEGLKIAPSARAETITLPQWLALAKALSTIPRLSTVF